MELTPVGIRSLTFLKEMKIVPRTKCVYIDPHTKLQCHREAKYMMCLTLHGETEPCNVLLCATCDKQQGRKTLTERHGWSLDDAIKWEKNPDLTPGALNNDGKLAPQAIRSTASAIRRTRAMINNTRY